MRLRVAPGSLRNCDSITSLDVHWRKLVKRGSVSTSTRLPGSRTTRYRALLGSVRLGTTVRMTALLLGAVTAVGAVVTVAPAGAATPEVLAWTAAPDGAVTLAAAGCGTAPPPATWIDAPVGTLTPAAVPSTVPPAMRIWPGTLAAAPFPWPAAADVATDLTVCWLFGPIPLVALTSSWNVVCTVWPCHGLAR
ncbi:hypothetical protein LMG9673_01103 [Ralstonia pseudosolanacearum]|nr:hypothetical protein LMG9673_01103 [Ralstonia pseudosolanacearum]